MFKRKLSLRSTVCGKVRDSDASVQCEKVAKIRKNNSDCFSLLNSLSNNDNENRHIDSDICMWDYPLGPRTKGDIVDFTCDNLYKNKHLIFKRIVVHMEKGIAGDNRIKRANPMRANPV